MAHMTRLARLGTIAVFALSAVVFGSGGLLLASSQRLAGRTPGSHPINIETHISGYLVALG